MEREAHQKRQNPRPAVLSVFSSLCSVASMAFCVFLSINTSDVTRRIVDLESRIGEPNLIRPVGYSVDDFNILIRDRVDELLSQRSYENLAKIRIARQADTTECNCPPGQPMELDIRFPPPAASRAKLAVPAL
ncbi:unnamed protein product [Gadus morhua 'NCC']